MREEKRNLFFVLFLLAVIVLRIPCLFLPLVGDFSTKQCAYAMIARNFSIDREFLFPKIDYIIDGKKSYHLLEFPFPAYLAGFLWRVFKGNLDFWGKVVNLMFFLGSLVFMFILVKKITSEEISYMSVLIFSILPLSFIFSVFFQMEGAMLFFLTGGICFFFQWYEERKNIFIFLWVIFSGLLFLLKPHALVYYFFPLSLFLIKRDKKRFFCQYIFFSILSFIPVILWILHVIKTVQVSSNIVYSLVDSVGVREFPPSLLFEFSFYKRLFERLSNVVFTPMGFTFLVCGVVLFRKFKYGDFLFFWGMSLVIYMFLLPRKMIELPYYLLPLAVFGSIFIADFISNLNSTVFKKYIIIFLLLIVSSIYFIPAVFISPFRNRCVLEASKFVEKEIPKEAFIVAAHGSGCDLLYYCKRPGWNLLINKSNINKMYTKKEIEYFAKKRKRILKDSVEEMKYFVKKGAQYLVIAPKQDLFKNKSFHKYVSSNFSLIKEGRDYIVYEVKEKMRNN